MIQKFIIICDKCKGFGYLEYDVGGHKPEYETGICDKCGGSGRLKQTTIVKLKSFVPDRNKSERVF